MSWYLLWMMFENVLIFTLSGVIMVSTFSIVVGGFIFFVIKADKYINARFFPNKTDKEDSKE